LSKFGNNFAVDLAEYKFGIGGDSHGFPLLLPKFHNVDDYNVELYHKALSNIQDKKNVTILIDSGITNDTLNFKKFISPDCAIRICYNDWSWPLLAKMFYTRCMAAVDFKRYHIFDFIKPTTAQWGSNASENWAIREKYFLYLKDHHFRYCWRPSDGCVTLPIEKILNYDSLHSALNHWFEVSDFEDFYKKWNDANSEHFSFYFDCLEIMDCVESRKSKDLAGINDLFTQAVVYYYIWIKYNFEVPHNTYSNWFTNTTDIVNMLQEYGVIV
jgi:hypothetical protein